MEALIDGDVLLYKATFAAQHKWYEVFDEDNLEFGWVARFPSAKACKEYMTGREGLIRESVIEVEPEEHAINNIRKTLRAIIQSTRCRGFRIFLSGKGNYREEIATILPYKGNRDPDHKPTHYDAGKNYIRNLPETVEVNVAEADDALGIAQFQDFIRASYEGVEPTTVIVTNDKDLRMIPGYHFNYWGNRQLEFVNQLEADRTFYKQMITGDSTDNIPGLYKITGKKAMPNILAPIDDMEDPIDMWYHVVQTYTTLLCNKGKDKEVENIVQTLEEIARLLWISRETYNDWEIPYGDSK